MFYVASLPAHIAPSHSRTLSLSRLQGADTAYLVHYASIGDGFHEPVCLNVSYSRARQNLIPVPPAPTLATMLGNAADVQ